MEKILVDLQSLSQNFSFAGIIYIIMRLELFIQKTNMRLEKLESKEHEKK